MLGKEADLAAGRGANLDRDPGQDQRRSIAREGRAVRAPPATAGVEDRGTVPALRGTPGFRGSRGRTIRDEVPESLEPAAVAGIDQGVGIV